MEREDEEAVLVNMEGDDFDEERDPIANSSEREWEYMKNELL
jgi:hypothetical protein